MRTKITLSFLFLLLIFLLAKVDRLCLKASGGFCLHYIDVPLQEDEALVTDAPFPAHLFDQPFSYLGKGSQNFVFESQGHVIKFYKFPSHLRRFNWVRHPFSYHFSAKRQAIKTYNENKLRLSYHSYLLAYKYLQQETGTLYVHLNPTSTGKQIHLKDKAGHSYKLPLDHLGFVIQKKGEPFLSLFQNHPNKTELIDGLIELIAARCAKGITDLDNMDHNNYGWAEGRAIHLDIGRFTFKENQNIEQEIRRVTAPLRQLLEKESPELLQHYLDKIRTTSSNQKKTG